MAALDPVDNRPWTTYFPEDVATTEALYAVFNRHSDVLQKIFTPRSVFIKMLVMAQRAGGLSAASEEQDMDVSNLVAYFVGHYESATHQQKILLKPMVQELREVLAKEVKANGDLLEVELPLADGSLSRLVTLLGSRPDIRKLLINEREIE